MPSAAVRKHKKSAFLKSDPQLDIGKRQETHNSISFRFNPGMEQLHSGDTSKDSLAQAVPDGNQAYRVKQQRMVIVSKTR